MVPWVEKYRPKLVSDVYSQEHIVKALQNADSMMPHLLFYGPPGTGKTSTILAVAKELFGPELMKTRVLELNASDDRKIDVVRNKIKAFASRSLEAPVPGYPCPPFNLIILDEADCMTQDAQSALRHTIEYYSNLTRFCFISNYISRIIDPLVSRCAKFRFLPLSGQSFQQKITEICELEGIVLEENAFLFLSEVCTGDLRKAITMLQSCHALYKNSSSTENNCITITQKQLQSVSGVIPNKTFAKLLREPLQTLESILEQGFSANDILLKLFDTIRNANNLTDLEKALISKELAITEKRLLDGADEFLQVGNILLKIQSILNGT